jgi:hypothetical protein
MKPGKNPTIAESYRPISLTTCLCKVLERIVNKRLVYILEERNLLPSQQYGFRKNKSTTENNIAEAIKKKTINRNGVSGYFKGLRYVLEIQYPKKNQKLENYYTS